MFLLLRALFNHVRSKVSRIDSDHDIDTVDTSSTSSGNIGTISNTSIFFYVLFLCFTCVFDMVFNCLDDLYSAILSSDIISIDEKALIPSNMDEGNHTMLLSIQFSVIIILMATDP